MYSLTPDLEDGMLRLQILESELTGDLVALHLDVRPGREFREVPTGGDRGGNDGAVGRGDGDRGLRSRTDSTVDVHLDRPVGANPCVLYRREIPALREVHLSEPPHSEVGFGSPGIRNGTGATHDRKRQSDRRRARRLGRDRTARRARNRAA